jgi:ketosteroid isomerase-like protein
MKTYSTLLLLLLPLFIFAQNLNGPEEDVTTILSHIQTFSDHVMAGEAALIAAAYTEDGKLFSNRKDIIEGRDAIEKYWTPGEGYRTSHHKITPVEITVTGDQAYDYGYYEGTTKRADDSEVRWKGKYVIVWKKVEGEWKIYLDIWNSIDD